MVLIIRKTEKDGIWYEIPMETHKPGLDHDDDDNIVVVVAEHGECT